jgi:hypothetical protein
MSECVYSYLYAAEFHWPVLICGQCLTKNERKDQGPRYWIVFRRWMEQSWMWPKYRKGKPLPKLTTDPRAVIPQEGQCGLLAWNAAPICRLLPMGLNKLNQSTPMSGPRHEGCYLGMRLPRGSPATHYLSFFPRYLFPSPCESYRDHPSWQISNWKRSQCNGELCNSLPYTLTDSCSYLQSRRRSRGGCPCNQGGYSCEHQISKGKEAVRCAL